MYFIGRMTSYTSDEHPSPRQFPLLSSPLLYFVRSQESGASQSTGRLLMRNTGLTLALVSTILLAGLTSLVSSKGVITFLAFSTVVNKCNHVDILLFYPVHLYKIHARTQITAKNERTSSLKYNPQPKPNYRMNKNKEKKEEKRWTRTIFENFWGGSKRYTRGKQSFGNFGIIRQIKSNF